MLKIEDLKVGDEVECVSSFHVEIKEKDRLEVTGVNERSIVFMSIKNGNKYTFNKSYMDCFKKIEKYTFDDLIDVAVQANKDRVIIGFSVVGGVLNCQTLNGKDYNLGIGKNVLHGIEYLQSLYKETFLIETMADELKIKSGAQLILSNGMKCIYFDDGDRKLRHDDDFYPCNFLVLKGATVTQKRGK